MARELIVYVRYCPNCDARLEVHEAGEAYIIVANHEAVSVCPGCLRGLVVVGGELEVDDDEE